MYPLFFFLWYYVKANQMKKELNSISNKIHLLVTAPFSCEKLDVKAKIRHIMNTADGRFSPFCGKIAIFAKKEGKYTWQNH